MKAIHKHAIYSAVATSVLLGGSLAAIPSAAAATTSAPPRCDEVTYYKVSTTSPRKYAAVGPVVSKRNGSSETETLTYTILTTKTRSSTWKAEGGGSLEWGIAKVEAKLGIEITKTAAKGRMVTNTMKVGAGKRGYTQPMVEYQSYVVDRYIQQENCKHHFLRTMGRLTGITSATHFAECVSASPCRPKP